MLPPQDHPWFQAHPIIATNIIDHWRQATPDEREEGMRWYAEAHQVAVAIAHGDARLGAGMLAIYSPQQNWLSNVRNAALVLRTGAGIGGPGCGMMASAARRRAADRLLAGEDYRDILAGPKVREFAVLIEHGGAPDPDPDPGHPHVVIDRHALSVACGRALTDAEYGSAPIDGSKRRDGSLNRRHYDYVAEHYGEAAAAISQTRRRPVGPHQVQAVTWLVRQRLNQAAEHQRGPTRLDRGRATARANAEQAWDSFRAAHLPELAACPGTGYLATV